MAVCDMTLDEIGREYGPVQLLVPIEEAVKDTGVLNAGHQADSLNVFGNAGVEMKEESGWSRLG